MPKLLKSGDRVKCQYTGAVATVLRRVGTGVTGQEYVQVRWPAGHETSEPTERFRGR